MLRVHTCHGQPLEQSLWILGETRIACLTIKKSPYLYPAAYQLAEKDKRIVTGKIEENNAEAQQGTSTEIILITMVF